MCQITTRLEAVLFLLPISSQTWPLATRGIEGLNGLLRLLREGRLIFVLYSLPLLFCAQRDMILTFLFGAE